MTELGQYGTSFPLRERGLKREGVDVDDFTGHVVPLAGTWIETLIRSE